jgi:hypothetical protein
MLSRTKTRGDTAGRAPARPGRPPSRTGMATPRLISIFGGSPHVRNLCKGAEMQLVSPLIFQFEASLKGHLVTIDFAPLDATSDLRYLEPAEMAKGLAGLRYGPIDRFADAGFG